MEALPQHIFVTGIGTGVGKTVASAVLTEALKADYWKPIQCGNLDDSDTIVVQCLISNQQSQLHAEAYRFETASSPHYAARHEGIEIDIRNCKQPVTGNRLIIEGAGGLLVPLSNDTCVVDLIKALNAPVVLVCRNYLGSINHTLLSIELLKQRRINLSGLIFSGDDYLDNEAIIEQLGNIKVLGRIAEAKEIDKKFVVEQAVLLRQSLSKFYEF